MAVGLVIMSERELNRIEVLSQVIQGRMTAVTAANVLGLSRRQVHRLLKDFQTDGPAAIRHKARGRRSNNRIDPAVREFAVTLVRETYIDFGPTFAAEKLAEDHGLKVSRETLRKWMQDAGIWLSLKHNNIMASFGGHTGSFKAGGACADYNNFTRLFCRRNCVWHG